MGVGIHGEPGRRRVKLAAADAIADEILGAVLGDLSLKRGSQALLLVNGFGGTQVMELYLMAHAARRVLGAAGVTVARSLTGSYVTSLEMAGCSLTVTALDAEMTRLWDAPVHTAALRWRL
jgi:dihydroxyacetone kinase-like protein